MAEKSPPLSQASPISYMHPSPSPPTPTSNSAHAARVHPRDVYLFVQSLPAYLLTPLGSVVYQNVLQFAMPRCGEIGHFRPRPAPYPGFSVSESREPPPFPPPTFPVFAWACQAG